jgi:hypothetical protein
MTVEHLVNQSLFDKIKAGQVSEINLPKCEAYADKFFQLKYPDNEKSEVVPKTITHIEFKTETESITKEVLGIFVDKFVKFIPTGFKKNEFGITIEFIV